MTPETPSPALTDEEMASLSRWIQGPVMRDTPLIAAIEAIVRAREGAVVAAMVPLWERQVKAAKIKVLQEAADEQERLSKEQEALGNRSVQFKRLIFATWLRDRAAGVK